MNLWAIIPLISFITFGVLVALVLQQARRRVDKVFVLFLAASATWSFSSFMLVHDTSSSHLAFWNSLVIAAIPWAAVCYYHFVRTYNNKPGGIGIYVGYALVLVVLGFGLSGNIVKEVYFVNIYVRRAGILDQ